MDIGKKVVDGLLVSKLPSNPGIYQFIDSDGQVIYVGKAKNLKKRVSSYFNKRHESRKTEILVRQIAQIRHVVVDTEEDALLLENNLIKKYQPKYNILLKDDKTFPWICIRNEPFPRIYYTRKRQKDGSSYFGPYTSVFMARTVLEVIKQLFPIRNCSFLLNAENVSSHKYKRCLEYQIGNCKAPCEELYSRKEYDQDIQNVTSILKGTLSPVFAYLKNNMQLAAEAYDFEKANHFKSRIQILENYRSKSLVCSASMTNLDVFSYADNDKIAFVNYFRIVDGAIVNTYILEARKKINETKEDLLAFCMVEIRRIFNSASTEIIVPFQIGFEFKHARVVVPSIGEKKKILDLCDRNARLYMLERQKNESVKSPQSKTQRLLDQVKTDLRLEKIPVRIECFDNSNIMGDFPVSSCVVFRDGKPLKSEYRHFNVKSVDGPNDFASMEEVVTRRYSRMLSEGNQLPELVIIDGGKGQLSMAVGVLEKLGIDKEVAIIGIAKRLEEIYFPYDPVPLYLDKKSETLRLIQQLRDEAHRFGITFHRNKRSSMFTQSVLESIPGIGPKTTEKLLKELKSVERIRQAGTDELKVVVGEAKAGIIRDFLDKN